MRRDVAAGHGGKLGTLCANLSWAVYVVRCCLPGPHLQAMVAPPEAYQPLQAWLKEHPQVTPGYTKLFSSPFCTWHSWSCLLGVVRELYQLHGGVSPCCGVKVCALHESSWEWNGGRAWGTAVAVAMDLQHRRFPVWMAAILENLMGFYLMEPGEELVAQLLLPGGKKQQQDQPKEQQQQQGKQQQDQPKGQQQQQGKQGKQPQRSEPEVQPTHHQQQSQQNEEQSQQLPQLEQLPLEASGKHSSNSSSSRSCDKGSPGSTSRGAQHGATMFPETQNSSSSSSASSGDDQPASLAAAAGQVRESVLSSPHIAASVQGPPRVGWFYAKTIEASAASGPGTLVPAAAGLARLPVQGTNRFYLLLELLLLIWPPAAAVEDGASVVEDKGSSADGAAGCPQGVGGAGTQGVRGADVGGNRIVSGRSANISSSAGGSSSSGSSSGGRGGVNSGGGNYGGETSSNTGYSSSSGGARGNRGDGGNDSASSPECSSSSSGGVRSSSHGGSSTFKHSFRIDQTTEVLPTSCISEQRWEWLLLLLVMLQGRITSEWPAHEEKQFNLHPPEGPQLLQLLYHILMQDVHAEGGVGDDGGLGSSMAVFDQGTATVVANANSIARHGITWRDKSFLAVAVAVRKAPCTLQQLSVSDLVTLVLQSLLYVGPGGVSEEVCSWALEGKLLLSGEGETWV